MKKAQFFEKSPSDAIVVPAMEIKEDYLSRVQTPVPMPVYPPITFDEPEVEAVYDPTQEIVDRLDRIAKALEESNVLARAELRVKGIEP